MSKPKIKSRTERWREASDKAEAALSELVSIQEEYQEWLDGLPENLQQSAVGEKLEAITSFDLQSALDTIAEAAGADLPLGFGRD